MSGLDYEELRIDTLKNFQILDTMPEQEFDDLTLLASQICEVPIALISFIDEDRQWFKSRVGLSATETPRDYAFCAHAIKGDDLFIVPDAAQDTRFSSNPLVTKDPHIRFYAGTPLITSEGYKLGTLCVIDRQPRELSEDQKRALNALGRSVINLLEARRKVIELNNLSEKSRAVLTVENTPENEKPIKAFFEIDDEKSENTSHFKYYLNHYLIATLVILSVTLAKVFIALVINIELPFILFTFGVLLCAWRSGFRVGLYATSLTVLIMDYFFIAPYGMLFERTFSQNLLLLIFFVQGTFISALCASRLKNERLLRQAGNELENRVFNRTKQLEKANKDLQKEIQERNFLQEDLQKARDVALESVRLKSAFLANMSHEIRTPMNGVIGVTGLLLDTKLNSEQKRFVEIIQNSGESLMTVINDILDFSKVEAGKLELETLDFNLRDTVEGTIELFSNRAQTQNNELAMLIYSDVPLNLSGDAGRIRQILSNLISNAIKFTKRGDIVVRVKKIRETIGQIELSFSVTDSGEGISKEVQTRLFQPFTQSDASTTRRYGGTGLGLSISRHLVELMNGKIGVESEEGKGSTFWFNITLEKQKTLSMAIQNDTKVSSTYPELIGRRILIVDDNAVNREVLVYQMQTWGMDTHESATGEEAIKLLKTAIKTEQPFELVVLDFQIPHIDGLETARQIITKNSLAANLPIPAIIALLPGDLKIDAETMQKIGISGFLTKPYRHDDLLDSIYKTLNLSQMGYTGESDIHITIKPETPIKSVKSKRILVVEDNTVNQLVAQLQLKRLGYRTDVVGNGMEAIKALEIVPYDLVLMDCQMPVMDGYEATRKIRARDWKAAQIPIIALTAHVIESEREKCFQAGMDDYISKPVEKDALRLIVNRWLSTDTELLAQAPIKLDTEDDLMLKESNSTISEETDPSTPDAVNIATLDDITGYDPEIRREVVEIYLAQTTVQINEIERAISVNDANTLYNMAHKTVGGSAICGMMAIVEPMRKLEQMGRDGMTDEAAPILLQAKQAFTSINEQCRRILEK
jgi:signal transduction histidine kinase/CheY-like chemotaxis protein